MAPDLPSGNLALLGELNCRAKSEGFAGRYSIASFMVMTSGKDFETGGVSFLTSKGGDDIILINPVIVNHFFSFLPVNAPNLKTPPP